MYCLSYENKTNLKKIPVQKVTILQKFPIILVLKAGVGGPFLGGPLALPVYDDSPFS
eukprot:UN18485